MGSKKYQMNSTSTIDTTMGQEPMQIDEKV